MKRKARHNSKNCGGKSSSLQGYEFSQLCQAIEDKISVERSLTKTYADKEYALLNRLPRFALRFGVWLIRKMDDYNLLPASFIDNDGLYCSAFIANLGSLKMEPGFHHLYEWGELSNFCNFRCSC